MAGIRGVAGGVSPQAGDSALGATAREPAAAPRGGTGGPRALCR